MHRPTRTTVRWGAAAAAAGLVLAGTGGALAAPRQQAAAAATPSLHAVIKDGKLSLTGDRSFPAGRVKLSLTSKGNEYEAGVIRMHKGYSFADFRSDVKTVNKELAGPGGNVKKGLRALNRAIDHVTVYGGFDAADGQTLHGTLLLPKAGTYYVFNDSGVPKQKQKLTVGAPAGPQKLPATDATVVAKQDRRWGGAKTLPAKGNITFKNKSTESPHFLFLQHVKTGTTRKQVMDSFQSNQPPTFLRRGQAGTDVLSSGKKMTMHLHLPAGDYAEMCFFPDPKTGMPHALMGMVRIVHLQ